MQRPTPGRKRENPGNEVEVRRKYVYTKTWFEKTINAVRNSKLYSLQVKESNLLTNQAKRKCYKEAISVLLIPKPSPLKVTLHRTIRNDDF